MHAHWLGVLLGHVFKRKEKKKLIGKEGEMKAHRCVGPKREALKTQTAPDSLHRSLSEACVGAFFFFLFLNSKHISVYMFIINPIA